VSKKVACLLALVLTLISFNVWAWDPPAAPHPPQSYVADVAHKLSDHDLSSLNAKLRQVNRSSSNEIAILIIPTVGDEAMSDIANLTFKTWQVGKKDLDNGVLIVIALKERKARIEVGKGIEGDLTDIQSSVIIRENIFPHWKRGNLYAGLASAVDAISSTVESRKKDAGTPVPSSTATPVSPSVPLTPNIPATSSGCSYSAGPISGDNMITFLVFCVLAYGFYRLYKFLDNQHQPEEWFPPPPPPRYTPPVRRYTPPPVSEPVYTPVYPRYTPPRSTYSEPAYTPPPPVRNSEPTVTETLGAVAGAAAVASLFDDTSDSTPAPSPSYSTPSYEPTPSYESDPSPSDDVGFGGGDSGGGGAEASWDDSSGSDTSSDSGGYDSGSFDS
jgi:uncharacterized membrane protein YgcG